METTRMQAMHLHPHQQQQQRLQLQRTTVPRVFLPLVVWTLRILIRPTAVQPRPLPPTQQQQQRQAQKAAMVLEA